MYVPTSFSRSRWSSPRIHSISERTVSRGASKASPNPIYTNLLLGALAGAAVIKMMRRSDSRSVVAIKPANHRGMYGK